MVPSYCVDKEPVIESSGPITVSSEDIEDKKKMMDEIKEIKKENKELRSGLEDALWAIEELKEEEILDTEILNNKLLECSNETQQYDLLKKQIHIIRSIQL